MRNTVPNDSSSTRRMTATPAGSTMELRESVEIESARPDTGQDDTVIDWFDLSDPEDNSGWDKRRGNIYTVEV